MAPTLQASYDAGIKPLLDQPGIEFIGEINDAQKSKFLSGALALLMPICRLIRPISR